MSQIISDLHEQWLVDSKLDINNLAEEDIRSRQELHGKWSGFLIDAQKAELKAYHHKKKIYKAKKSYYLGHYTADQLKRLGWEAYPFTVLRNEVDELIDADDHYQVAETALNDCKIVTKFIESCLAEIKARGYTIKNALAWQTLIMGA